MNADLLLDNLAAIAAGPGGVDRLREVILQLAVRGNLGTQDPTDEPASVLLGSIKKEKERLVKAGEIKREKSSDTISNSHSAFSIPDGWVLVSLHELGMFTGGVTPSTSNLDYWNGDIPWVSPKDVKSKYILDSELKVSQSALENFRLSKIPKDSIIIVARSGILKRTLPVAITKIECTVNQDIKVIIPYLPSIAEYLHVLLKGYERFILTKLVKGGMTVQSLKYDEFEHHPFPLPPLAEQKRIVEKVNRLMALCDDLEARQQAEREERRRLRTASLTALEEAATAEEAERAWAHVAREFGRLVDNVEDVAIFRQNIRQLAIRGRLVRQEEGDESVAKLMEKIGKERLGETEKEKHDRPPEEFENLFRIPNSWKWVKLNQICTLITDGTHVTPTYIRDGIPFLSVKDVSGGKIDFTNTRFISQEEHNEISKRCNPNFGDILFTKVGTTGIARVVDVKREFSIFVSLALLRFPKQHISPQFLELVLNSPFVKEQSSRNTQGVGNKNLVLKSIKKFDIPLSPYPEQHRIVEKVDRMMAFCDTLEAGIRARDAALEAFAAAACRAVIGGPALVAAPAAGSSSSSCRFNSFASD